MSVYRIENLRVILPSKKVADKNPDRVFAVTGTKFFDAEDAELGITSKIITRDMVNSEGFSLDLATSTLTISDGRKGRRPTTPASDADILAAIEAAKNTD